MNKQRILELADAIEKDRTPLMAFDMTSFRDRTHRCCTSACIAGWTVMLFAREVYNDIPYSQIADLAQALLGLRYHERNDLFTPSLLFGRGYGEITSEDAVEVLRHFAETGVVDWKRVGFPFVPTTPIEEEIS